MNRRVVITGLGPVSSIGIGVKAFGQGLRDGASGISAISSFDSSGFPHYMAGEVTDFEPHALLRTLSPSEWGRTSLFAAAAARLAVEDAGLDEETLAGAAAGSSIGTTSGESQVIEALTAEWVDGGLSGVSPAYAAQVPAARLAAAVNQELGLTGEAVTLSTACSASNYALGYAYDQIVTGDADYMIAGGADSVCRWAHAGFYRLGALTKEVCSPFDKDRSGILTGEGGAALFLETLESATERGAHIYAEVLGYGLNCDANHMVAPDPVSIAACMRRAHSNAGITPADVDYICAHGTGTPANDAMEAQAAVEVFGDQPPPISSIKSMLGHTMGAASGFGAIACALAIDEGFLPPTTNYRTPDPALPAIDPVPNESRPARLKIVQNNGFAFGGNNAITILGQVA
ncbi:3-oxoacyl-ACP synthase [Streptomyces sp. NWU339]|uniref:beta-ketoacyl-[acyl-carrier-protein] synthase family protein n=1 Tax=Streptomyces sp. NWU339 TaxID=2185284 RepID=UPI000D67314F|nr:beta-ketoacyl-[acyl-carrier-protein] synthase family protein [Streptomyces sp. NWU339]PWI06375.1 3-oxoacyl-ACP synthase [Streptomyces sp. NWU339]